VVSGVPRSGTSLAMQMLAAGGVPVLADAARPPDASNPRGYFEWAPARRLAEAPERIAAARGRAVKIVSALVPALPPGERYCVLWLARDPREVARSQRAMLARLAAARGAPPPADDGVSAEMLARHAARARAALAARPDAAALDVAHRELLARPAAAAARIAAFLAPHLGLRLDEAAMAAVVDPALWRERAADARA